MNSKDVEEKLKLNLFKPLYEVVFEIIYENILYLKLIPGDILNERELAKDLQVSRTTVNNALKKLSDIGFVECSSRRHTIVSNVSYNDCIRLWKCRTAIETAAAEEAILNMTEQDIEILANYNNELAIFERDIKKYLYGEENFHYYIIKCSKNPYLINTYNLIKPAILRYLSLTYFYYLTNDLYFTEHKLILESFKFKYNIGAGNAIKSHLSRAYNIPKKELDITINNTIKLIKDLRINQEIDLKLK